MTQTQLTNADSDSDSADSVVIGGCATSADSNFILDTTFLNMKMVVDAIANNTRFTREEAAIIVQRRVLSCLNSLRF